MTKNKSQRNQTLIIIALLLVGIGIITVMNTGLSVVGVEQPSFTYVAQVELIEGTQGVAEAFTVLTPPVQSADFTFKVNTIDETQACLSSPTQICLVKGQRTTISQFIDVTYNTIGRSEEDDTTFQVNFDFFIDTDNALSMDYTERTGLQLQETFTAPISVTSEFQLAMNVGLVTESRSLLLEGESTTKAVVPQRLSRTETYTSPIDTTSLGLNEVRIRPFIRFSREDRSWDVPTKKILVVNFRVSPLVEGQSISDLPQGSVGLLDFDSPVQREFSIIQESLGEATDIDKNPLQTIFLLIISTIVVFLLVNIVRNRRKK